MSIIRTAGMVLILSSLISAGEVQKLSFDPMKSMADRKKAFENRIKNEPYNRAKSPRTEDFSWFTRKSSEPVRLWYFTSNQVLTVTEDSSDIFVDVSVDSVTKIGETVSLSKITWKVTDKSGESRDFYPIQKDTLAILYPARVVNSGEKYWFLPQSFQRVSLDSLLESTPDYYNPPFPSEKRFREALRIQKVKNREGVQLYIKSQMVMFPYSLHISKSGISSLYAPLSQTASGYWSNSNVLKPAGLKGSKAAPRF